MKILAIIGLSVVFIVTCVLLPWHDANISRDRDEKFRQKLAGVWLRELDNMRCTNTVAADGSFVELSWFSHSDRTNTYQRTGTWLVKNGDLIETVKTSSNPTEVTPHSDDGRIVSVDAFGFAVRWQHSTNETIWLRATK